MRSRWFETRQVCGKTRNERELMRWDLPRISGEEGRWILGLMGGGAGVGAGTRRHRTMIDGREGQLSCTFD